MSTTWRMAGLNYVNYSNIAAKTLRHSLKDEFRRDAARRDVSFIRYHYWLEGEILGGNVIGFGTHAPLCSSAPALAHRRHLHRALQGAVAQELRNEHGKRKINELKTTGTKLPAEQTKGKPE